MASGIFLFTRVLGIGVRLYLGGAIMVVIWRYLFPSLPVNLNTYIWGILFVTIITTIYTAVGGIKAVVWTDVIQAVLMFSSVIFAIFLLLRHIPGGLETVKTNLGGWSNVKLFQTGWDPQLPFGPALKAMLEEPYTIFAAFVGSTLLTMATHGTDQDMVQRMLTAPDHRKSQLSLILSGLMDIPIAGAFLTVGILLSVYYAVVPGTTLPAADNEIFGHYIVHEMPVVFRGLIIAGVFATMMGSTSAALNALATSFTKDFYLPYIRPDATDRQAIRAARIATAIFGVLMIIVAAMAANAVLQDAKLTIIPIAIGILVGIMSVLVLCKVSLPAFDFLALLHGKFVAVAWNFGWFMPEWWPKISWPWFVFVGCSVTLAIAVLFRTPATQIAAAEAHVGAATSSPRV
jgi:Na+/proline symporter